MLGGLAGTVCSASLTALLVCSAVIGLGVGINLTLSYAIICDYCTGDERGVLMGWNTAFVCISGVLCPSEISRENTSRSNKHTGLTLFAQ